MKGEYGLFTHGTIRRLFRGGDNDDTNTVRGLLPLAILSAEGERGQHRSLSVRGAWRGASEHAHPGGLDPDVLTTGDGGDGGVDQQADQRDGQPVDHEQQHVALVQNVPRLKQKKGQWSTGMEAETDRRFSCLPHTHSHQLTS